MKYRAPKGLIIDVAEKGNTSRLIIEFDKMDIGPVAPAGLYNDPSSGKEQFQLHRVAENKGLIYTFETFNRPQPLPKAGQVYFYRGWWLQEAMDAVLDTNANWEWKNYPDNGDHAHCLFTWENIAFYADCNEGYFSEKYGWITVEAYNKFIRGDIYNLRDRNA